MLKFAQRVNSMKGSAARAMLNITRKPGVISFAGGLPGTGAVSGGGICEGSTERNSG